MTSSDDTTAGPQGDPQTHLDTDPVNAPADASANDPDSAGGDQPDDVEDDPAHDTGNDEGWTSEGGATPSGPATDT